MTTAAQALATHPTSDEVLCSLRGINQSFVQPGGKTLTVLQNIDLDVRSGEILAVLGPSGCGKSTLLRIIVGLLKATAGSVLYRDRPLGGINPGVAVVFQNFALYPWLTVRQNVEEALVSREGSARTRRETASKTIETVGLGGFEDTYPRELSGGMKQRVGIARALAVKPEILCMDEPFSALDALTSEHLRAEVVHSWREPQSPCRTIFMVSHDIKEVVFMASRIVVLAANPGRIRLVLDNTLPYPRDYRAPAFNDLVERIHAEITAAVLPDEMVAVATPEPPAAVAAEPWEPLPEAPHGQMVALLDVLRERGGRANVFKLASDLASEFGMLLGVVKGAELLEWAETPRQDVVLTEAGRAFLAAAVSERPALFRESLLQLAIVRDVVALLRRAEVGAIEGDVVREQIAIRMPYETAERVFDVLVDWGRYADLLDYDREADRLSLNTPPM